MRADPLRRFAWTSLVLAGCTGIVSDPGAPIDDPRMPPTPVVCTGDPLPSTAPLGRFTHDEYERALRSLFGDGAVDASQAALDAIPVEAATEDGAFGRQDQRLSERHIEGYYRVADELAARVAADPALRMRAGGACDGAVDDACVRAFAEQFLTRAHRRPLDDAEIDAVLADASEFSGEDQIHAVVFLGLMAPGFLYRFENRGAPSGDVIALTPHEIASRLSYHFWGAPPDDALLAAAASGALDDADAYEAEVARLFDDPRTDAMLMTFFAEWLHLDRGSFAPSPRLEVLRDGIDVAGLDVEMRAELDDLLHHYLADPAGTWDDVLTSNLSFARTPRLAALYGADVWDGVAAPPTLPEGERSGLLTRAGMLRSTDGSTNPFRRGVFVRRTMLCDVVAPPPSTLPPDALTPPPVEAGATTRQAFEAKVVDEPCASCHAQFAPLGYGLEEYDGLGRFRTEERLVNTDGDDLGVAPVVASIVPGIDPGDDRPTSSGVALSARVAESPRASACLSRQYFRFAYRHVETSADRCTIDAWAAAMEDGLSLGDALRNVALDPTFRQRVLED